MAQWNDLVRLDLTSAKPAANIAFNEQVVRLISEGNEIAHFAFGLSPFPIPDFAQEALKEFTYKKEYLAVAGTEELRKQITKFHSRYDDLELDYQRVIVGPGSKQLIYLSMATFNGVILIPSPGWTTYEPQAVLAGKVPITIPTEENNGWKLTAQSLKDACKILTRVNKMLILTNPGNPSGTCFTKEELQAIANVCREEGIVVYSDEIYARISFSGNHSPLAKYYPEGTIVSSGFSKAFSAGGWRIGYCYFPESLLALCDAVKSAASQTYTSVAAPMQFAFEKVLRLYPQEIEKYTRLSARILEVVGSYCHRELSSVGVTGPRSEGGYYYMPNFECIRKGLNKRGIYTGIQMTTAILEEAKVALLPSEVFSGPKESLSVRLCFVCFDGTNAMKEVDNQTQPLDDTLVEKNCKVLVGGIQRLKQWVQKHA